MNEIEPTQETLAWICKNAEEAWQEGDPKKLQFWEDQKQEFQRKCYQRIESLVKQKALLQQQQEILIQKIKNGEYTPEQANQINQQIYVHSEELKRQIHFYRKLLEYPTDEINSGEFTTDKITNNSATSEIPFQNVIPIEQYFYELFLSTMRAIFLSNIGQITICFIILVIAVYLTWIWNTRNQQPQFEYISIPTENRYIIRIHNRGMLSAKIYLSQQNRWEFAPYLYFIECSAETGLPQQKKKLQIPLNCFFLENDLFSPINSTYLEIPPGSEKGFGVDGQCIQQNLTDITKITITIRKLLFYTEILKFNIDIQ